MKGHVVVATYPAQGHINPLLQFCKRLASKGLKATLATTHYTATYIHAQAVGIEPFSDGFDEGGFKHSAGVGDYLESLKKNGSRTLAHLILKYKATATPVDCLVYDSLLPWALDVAREVGVRAAAFLTNSASVCSLYWKVDRGLLTVPVTPELIPLPMPDGAKLEVVDLPTLLVDHVENSPYLALIMDQISSLDQNDWVFVNSFEELESQLAKAMSSLWQVKMVGPMVPSYYLDRQIEGDANYGTAVWDRKPADERCLKWLDTKPTKTVIYVSFGSMADVAAKQVEEMAWGLKASNKHFLWVVRESDYGKVPLEFVKSIDQVGLLVSWCDQLKVLGHGAVGCFITHCGWNSTLEGLSLGVPMVALPQWTDQPANAKFVEEAWKVGLKAKKNEEGIVTRKEIESCVREVMGGENSEEMKSNASKYRDLAKKAVSEKGGSDNNVDRFVTQLVKARME